MRNTTGRSFPRTSLSSTEGALTWPMALLLLGLGAAAVVLQAQLRLPMRLPGHQGIVLMAMLLLGRASTRYRWATSVAGAGATIAAALPLWAANEPLPWLAYVLPGIVVDAGLQLAPRWRASLGYLALLAGLGYATKPLVQLAISLSGAWAFRSQQGGLLFPLAAHLLFGALGGLLGAGVGGWLARRRD